MSTGKAALPAPSSGTPQVSMTFRRVEIKNERLIKEPESSTVFVDPNGHTLFNVTATEELLDLAQRAGLDRGKCLLDVSVNDEGYAALLPKPLGTSGCAKVSLHKKGTASIQLHEVLKEDPDLRPVVRQRIVPFIIKNADGQECMVIGLKIGQDNPKAPRKKSDAKAK